MSLEQALADHGKKLDELIALKKREIELREQGLEAVGKAAEKAGVAKKETKAAEPKAEKVEKPAAKDDGADDLIEQAKNKIAEYVSGTDREEERKARKLKIKKLLNNEKVKKSDAPENTTNLADVKPEMIGAVIKNVEKYITAGDITEPAPATGGDDLDID